MLVGLTALSVEISTSRSTAARAATSASTRVPRTLFLIASHGIELHQRHVLVRGSVKHQLHVPLAKRLLEPGGVAYVADDRRDGAFRLAVAKFLFDVVEAVFMTLVHHHHARFERRYLAAQLGSDRSACTRDHNALAFDNAAQPGRVQSHGPAAKQVLQRDAAHVAHPYPPIQHARQAGQNFYRQPERLEHPQDAADGLRSHPRHRYQHLLRRVRGNYRSHLAPRPKHANAVNHPPDLHAIVIDEADRAVSVIRIVKHIADDQLARIARAEDQHASAGPLALVLLIQDSPQRAGPTEKRDYYDGIDGVNGSRYPWTINRQRHEGREQDRRGDFGGGQIDQVAQARYSARPDDAFGRRMQPGTATPATTVQFERTPLAAAAGLCHRSEARKRRSRSR